MHVLAHPPFYFPSRLGERLSPPCIGHSSLWSPARMKKYELGGEDWHCFACICLPLIPSSFSRSVSFLHSPALVLNWQLIRT